MSQDTDSLERLRKLNSYQIESLLLRIQDVARVFGLTYSETTLFDVSDMLNTIKRINPNEADLIWSSLSGGYRFVIVWKGKRYGVYTDLPYSLLLPIALMDENGNLVAHVVVNSWESFEYIPEIVTEYTGDLKESWFIRADSIPEGYVHNFTNLSSVFRLTKFEWDGKPYFMKNPKGPEEGFRPIYVKGKTGIFLKATSMYPTQPRQMIGLHEVDFTGEEPCTFALPNPEVRL